MVNKRTNDIEGDNSNNIVDLHISTHTISGSRKQKMLVREARQSIGLTVRFITILHNINSSKTSIGVHIFMWKVSWEVAVSRTLSISGTSFFYSVIQ